MAWTNVGAVATTSPIVILYCKEHTKMRTSARRLREVLVPVQRQRKHLRGEPDWRPSTQLERERTRMVVFPALSSLSKVPTTETEMVEGYS